VLLVLRHNSESLGSVVVFVFLFICYYFGFGPSSCSCPVSSLMRYRRILIVHKFTLPKPAGLNLVSISWDRSYLRSSCRAPFLEDQVVTKGYTSEESTEANFFGDWSLHFCSRHHYNAPLPCGVGPGKGFFPAGKFYLNATNTILMRHRYTYCKSRSCIFSSRAIKSL
jgi:hypothetical protein